MRFNVSSPILRPAPPVPPLPPSPAMHSIASPPFPPPSPSISRSSSASSSSSQRVSTPPPRRSRTGSKLLPALPLSINTQLTPTRSKRVAVDYSGVPIEGVQPEISREEKRASKPPTSPPSPAIVCTNGTPPRLTRRSRRSSTASPRPPNVTPSIDLLPPRPRLSSPSTDSLSTISDAATPRPISQSDRPEAIAPTTSQTLINTTDAAASSPMGRKRDSAQRRLSALRGLVANLDFNQPWSTIEPDTSNGGCFWACGDPQESDESVTEAFLSSEEELVASPAAPISMPMPLVHDAPSDRPRSRRKSNTSVLQDHGWDSPKVEVELDATPVRNGSTSRKPNITPPRRPRQFRSSSELHRTPEPPRPASRQRKEVFEVASSGYSKCHEPASPVLPTTPTPTWRNSLSSDDIYSQLLQTHGPLEIKRQEVMWVLSQTELVLVKSMRTVLRLFAIPLKTPQGKWIDGIPERITELFDSLERVAHTHGIISAAQRDMRRRGEVLDVGAFGAMFKA